MAVRTREEILTTLRGVIGENDSDDALTLLDDITDTMSDLENRSKNDGTDWKKKYEDNDANWRKKYRDRFFSGGSDDDDDEPDPHPRGKNYTFENLFKEG